MNLILVGLMGAGKTSIGKKVALRLGYRFIDTDEQIVFEQYRSIPEIFAQEGEEYFRQLETSLIKTLVFLNNTIVSTGGGILTTRGNTELLKKIGKVIYLKADLEEIFQRISQDTNRPLLKTENPKETLGQLLSKRSPLYEHADLMIETKSLNIHQIATQIIHSI